MLLNRNTQRPAGLLLFLRFIFLPQVIGVSPNYLNDDKVKMMPVSLDNTHA